MLQGLQKIYVSNKFRANIFWMGKYCDQGKTILSKVTTQKRRS